MRFADFAARLRPLAIGAVLLAGLTPLLHGCGGEAPQTGGMVKEDPDMAKRNKEMEDYLNSQKAAKKK